MSKYKFAFPSHNERNKFTVTIEADSNDGDCITTKRSYKKEFFDEHVVDELIDLLSKHNRHCELEDFRCNYLSIPMGENGRCHSLESVDIKYVDTDGMTLDVELYLPKVEEDEEDEGED